MAFLSASGNLPTFTNITYNTYKAIFNYSAIWLQNAGSVSIGKPIFNNFDIPLPLLGFVYDEAESVELLKYSYGENPYLNKAMLTLAYMKEPTSFSILAYKVITNINKVPLNITTNMALLLALEMYCDRGGLFTLCTPYGIHKDLALVSLNGVKVGSDNTPLGVGFKFEFRKVLTNKASASVLSSALNRLSGGFL